MKLKHIFLTLAATALFSTAQAQVKVGANPGTIGTNSALEVEATNGNKTIIDKTTGKVTIQDGSQGAGKILTSDASGASTWLAPAAQNSEVLLSVQLTTPQNITGENPIVYNTKNFDKGNNFTLPGTFTAPSDGYYLLNLNIISARQPASRNARGMFFTVSGSVNYSRTLVDSAVELNDGYSATGTALIFLRAADQITTTAYAVGYSYVLSSAYFQIVKVSN